MVRSPGPSSRARTLLLAAALALCGCVTARDPALLTSTAPVSPFQQCTFQHAAATPALDAPAAPGCGLGNCALPKCGAGSCLPKIDQSGQRLFEKCPPKYKQEPGPHHAKHRPSSVVVSPRRVIAPVGSEVVVLAGVCGRDGYLRADENVQWALAPGGVGHFLAVGRRESIHFLNIFTDAPEKIDNTFAIGATSGRYVMLNRGTPTTDDDVAVQRGQAWITVSSPVEGTSWVTAFAPSVYGWDTRQQTAAIHWVDAQWTFPPPAANPLGSRQVFTTTVSRYSDRTPVEGYRVRYEILSGPDAAFAPDGARFVEALTNSLGQASVEIFQAAPAGGVNQIGIQVIQPPNSSTGAQRLILGTGSTTMTWTSRDVALSMTGPAQASIGALATYRVDVSNPSDVAVRDVVVTDQLPEGMTHVSSNPLATIQGSRLEFRLGDLGPRQSRSIELNVRVDQPGTFNHCVALATGEGLNAQDCVTTTVMSPTLDVRMTAPEQVGVGGQVTFQVSLTNRSEAALAGLRIVSRFDAGLQHDGGPSPLERTIDAPLAPGQTTSLAITMTARQAGQLCNSVEVVSPAGTLGTARSCVNAVAAPAGAGQPSISVEKTGPATSTVGEVAEFNIDIANNGSVAVNELRVRDNYDVALDPVRATDGYSFVGEDLVWLIDTLPPGRRVRLQIQCRCQQAIGRACNRVTVTTREGAQANNEACLEIRAAAGGGAPPVVPPPTSPSPTPGQPTPAEPQPFPSQPQPTPAQPQPAPAQTEMQAGAGNLSVSITDRRDPVFSGREATYEVRVSNRAATSDRNVRLTVVAPDGMTPLPGGTVGPEGSTIVGSRIEFAPIGEIPPNETRTYQVRLRADRQGTVRVQAQVTSQGHPTPVTAEETTTITAQ